MLSAHLSYNISRIFCPLKSKRSPLNVKQLAGPSLVFKTKRKEKKNDNLESKRFCDTRIEDLNSTSTEPVLRTVQ